MTNNTAYHQPHPKHPTTGTEGCSAAAAMRVEPGLNTLVKSPCIFGAQMRRTIGEIAKLNTLMFRFWATKTLVAGFSCQNPRDFAQTVLAEVIGAAIRQGEPIDGSYQAILNDEGRLRGIATDDVDDEEAIPPDHADIAIFSAVGQPTPAERYYSLAELVAGWPAEVQNWPGDFGLGSRLQLEKGIDQ